MITDIHCHFIPLDYFAFVRSRGEFAVSLGPTAGETITVRCRGLDYGLNPVFFEPSRQIARMEQLGIDRTVVSLATPLVNYHVEPTSAVEAARLCNDGFAQLVSADPARFGAWAFCRCRSHPSPRRSCVVACGNTVSWAGMSRPTCAALISRTRVSTHLRRRAGSRCAAVPASGRPARARPHGRVRAHRRCRLPVRHDHQHLSHDLQQFSRSLQQREARLRAHRRLQPDVAQSHAARGRHKSGAVAQHEKGGRLSARLFFDTVCFEPEYLRFATTSCPPNSSCWQRRTVSARRTRSGQFRAQGIVPRSKRSWRCGTIIGPAPSRSDRPAVRPRQSGRFR